MTEDTALLSGKTIAHVGSEGEVTNKLRAHLEHVSDSLDAIGKIPSDALDGLEHVNEIRKGLLELLLSQSAITDRILKLFVVILERIRLSLSRFDDWRVTVGVIRLWRVLVKVRSEIVSLFDCIAIVLVAVFELSCLRAVLIDINVVVRLLLRSLRSNGIVIDLGLSFVRLSGVLLGISLEDLSQLLRVLTRLTDCSGERVPNSLGSAIGISINTGYKALHNGVAHPPEHLGWGVNLKDLPTLADCTTQNIANGA